MLTKLSPGSGSPFFRDDFDAEQFELDYKNLSIKYMCQKYNVNSHHIHKIVKKLNININISPRWKDEYIFTERQKDIVNGSLLGDGSLRKLINPNSISAFNEKHGLPQYNWLIWKKVNLEPIPSRISFVDNPESSFYKNGILKKVKGTKQSVINTSGNQIFTELEKYGIKEINLETIYLIN